MSVTVHGWNEGVSLLRPEWEALVLSQGLNPSLHPDWLDITVGSHDLAARAMVISVTRPSGKRAIVPLLARQISVAGVPLRCLDLCSNVVSYHAGLVADGDHEDVIGEIMQSRQLAGFDVLRLGNLVSAAPTAVAAESIGLSWKNLLSYPEERSPYIAMETDWAGFLASLPKKMRANITRCIRQTQQAGETGMLWYEQGCDATRLLADILEVEARSWKASDNKAIRADAAEGTYYDRLLPWLSKTGLLANVLYVKDKPAAYVLCARWHGWVGQLKTSFAADVRDAGFRVIHASIERAWQSGQEREYDFLGDVAPHKTRWTDRIRPHESKWLFARHWRGRAMLRFKRAVDAWKRRQPAPAPATEEPSPPPPS
jgi:CelD/BcsL family acetyltransferase involved in cellulose biosynthesis